MIYLFTSIKGPAELSLHSFMICCLVFSSGQQLGSLDSKGSITYKHTQVDGNIIITKVPDDLFMKRKSDEEQLSRCHIDDVMFFKPLSTCWKETARWCSLDGVKLQPLCLMFKLN